MNIMLFKQIFLKVSQTYRQDCIKQEIGYSGTVVIINMEAKCTATCVFMIILVIGNVAIVGAGISLIAYGSLRAGETKRTLEYKTTINVDSHTFHDFLGHIVADTTKVVVGLMIAFGMFVMAVGVLGIIIVFTRNSYFLKLDILLLAILFLFSIPILILGDRSDDLFAEAWPAIVKEELINMFTKDANVTNYSANGTGYEFRLVPPTDKASNAWMTIQLRIGCCGASGFIDYKEFNWRKLLCSDLSCPPNFIPWTQRVPISCCVLKTNGSLVAPQLVNQETFINLPDCLSKAGSSSTHQLGCAKPTNYDATIPLAGWATVTSIFMSAIMVETFVVIFLSCAFLRYLSKSERQELGIDSHMRMSPTRRRPRRVEGVGRRPGAGRDVTLQRQGTVHTTGDP